jgi:hypothetical protein
MKVNLFDVESDMLANERNRGGIAWDNFEVETTRGLGYHDVNRGVCRNPLVNIQTSIPDDVVVRQYLTPEGLLTSRIHRNGRPVRTPISMTFNYGRWNLSP